MVAAARQVGGRAVLPASSMALSYAARDGWLQPSAQQVGAGRMVGVVAGQLALEAVHGRQCHLGAVKLGDRDGPVEGDDRRLVKAGELVVEGNDLRPVGVAHLAGGGMHGVDRREE